MITIRERKEIDIHIGPKDLRDMAARLEAAWEALGDDAMRWGKPVPQEQLTDEGIVINFIIDQEKMK